MKPISVAGVVLVVLGALALVYQGITYTSRETVVDIGPIHATADRQKTVPLSPVLGMVAVVGGVALLVVGAHTRVGAPAGTHQADCPDLLRINGAVHVSRSVACW